MSRTYIDAAWTGDPSSLGFEKIMARFDRLEFLLDSRDRRIDKLGTPRIPYPDPPYFSDDADSDGHRSQRDGWTAEEDIPWPFNHGRRYRGGDIRSRRGDARDLNNRGGRFPQFGMAAAPYRSRPDTRPRSSWERPTDRYPQELDRGFQQPTRFRTCHEQPSGWPPPPQHSPPSYWPSRNAYEKQQQTHAYRQQHQPVAAHMEPLNRFGYSRSRHQSNPTPVYEHSSYTCTQSDAALQNPDAEYRVRQSDYPPPRLPSYRSSALPCTTLADPPTATTQSRSCHEQPTIVLQPLLGPTSLQRSAIPPMAPAAVPPPSSHLPSTRPTPQLVSCEELHLGVEGNSQVLNQVDLRLNEMKLVDEEVRAIAVDKIDDDDGLHDSSKMNEEEASLDDVEEDDSIEEVPKVIASFPVVQVQSKSIVDNCWGKKGDSAYTGLSIIVGVYVDLSISDVTSMNHRSTSLDTDARLIPPRNDMFDSNILGGVDKLGVVAWNFANHIGSPLLIFYGCDEERRSAVRCVFDPGGDASPKHIFMKIVMVSWFPP